MVRKKWVVGLGKGDERGSQGNRRKRVKEERGSR